MRIVDSYEINDGQIFSVELAEDRFVDVKVCDGKLDGFIYVVQNEDGSTVYSDKAYTDKGIDAVYPGFVYDEKAVLDLVKEAMNKGMGKIRVAIESTDDYSDATFYARLVEDDVRNEDGTYGKVVDSYRIVRINENGKIDKLDERVFASAEEARDAALRDARLELVSYDDLVHEAGKGLGAVIVDAQDRASNCDIDYCASIIDAESGQYLVEENNGVCVFGSAENRILFYDEADAESTLEFLNDTTEYCCVLVAESMEQHRTQDKDSGFERE